MSHDAPVIHPNRPVYASFTAEVTRNILVALSVSFVALSLGAAFGVLSGRGAFIGMFSAGLIALIAAIFGGTRVQCSGPTAPMAAVMAGLFTSTTALIASDPNALGGMSVDHYLNLSCLLCGVFMILMVVLRTGKLIAYVPDHVISGFMTGIGLIIWIGQLQILFGLGKTPLQGDLVWNAIIAFGTFALTFLATPVMSRISKTLARLVPGTLFALIIAVAFSAALHLNIEHVEIKMYVKHLIDFAYLVGTQVPQHITLKTLASASFYGFEFALISYLDTLMVSLIMDRLSGETTKKNKELAAQGIANSLVAFIGGIPGTQASIRSVMMLQEGATMRLAGIMVGVFVIVFLLAFQQCVEWIPKAVFMGILLKVGWNVCDRKPLVAYVTRKSDRLDTLSFITILGTAIVTVYNLCLAVVLFTAVYYGVRRYQKKPFLPHAPIPGPLKDAPEWGKNKRK